MRRGAGLPNPPGGPAILEPGRSARRRSMAAHHRRRRAVAIASLTVLGVLGVVLIVLGGGGGVAARSSVGAPGDGFFGRVHALAGSGAGSLAAR